MRTPPQRRIGNFIRDHAHRPRRLARWLGEHPNAAGWVVAAAMFLAPLAIVGKQQSDLTDLEARNRSAIERINEERVQRLRVQAAFNTFVCGENQEQDDILATLVEASLASQTFGAGLDLSSLSEFELGVLAAIAKIQRLAEEEQAGLQRVFRQALADLRDEADCSFLPSLRAPARGERLPSP